MPMASLSTCHLGLFVLDALLLNLVELNVARLQETQLPKAIWSEKLHRPTHRMFLLTFKTFTRQ